MKVYIFLAIVFLFIAAGCAGNTAKIVYVSIEQCTEQGNNSMDSDNADLKTETDMAADGEQTLDATVIP